MRWGAFRDRKVAAPLKPADHLHAPPPPHSFRDRKVAAPLKRRRLAARAGRGGALPRPKGRGPIEASISPIVIIVPRPFRDRKVAAPLKH